MARNIAEFPVQNGTHMRLRGGDVGVDGVFIFCCVKVSRGAAPSLGLGVSFCEIPEIPLVHLWT